MVKRQRDWGLIVDRLWWLWLGFAIGALWGRLRWRDTLERYARCYLAHNLMLIAWGTYWKRQPTLRDYVRLLDWMVREGIANDLANR
jgi:hypothetical protein